MAPPLAAWIHREVFPRVPAAPFLSLMPARTAVVRSLSMASLMAGLLGLAFFASLAVGTWLLVVALVGAGVLTLGSSRAIGSYWWPTALAGALVGLALSLMLITNLAPWASVSVLETPQAFVLAAGGFALLGLAVWSSTVMVQALRRLEALQEQP